MLNKPGKRPGKAAVELPGVDPLGNRFDDFGTATRPVAPDAVGVVCPEPAQNPGAVQKVVHQRIDRDHAAADCEPAAPTARCPGADGAGLALELPHGARSSGG